MAAVRFWSVNRNPNSGRVGSVALVRNLCCGSVRFCTVRFHSVRCKPPRLLVAGLVMQSAHIARFGDLLHVYLGHLKTCCACAVLMLGLRVPTIIFLAPRKGIKRLDSSGRKASQL